MRRAHQLRRPDPSAPTWHPHHPSTPYLASASHRSVLALYWPPATLWSSGQQLRQAPSSRLLLAYFSRFVHLAQQWGRQSGLRPRCADAAGCLPGHTWARWTQTGLLDSLGWILRDLRGCRPRRAAQKGSPATRQNGCLGKDTARHAEGLVCRYTLNTCIHTRHYLSEGNFKEKLKTLRNKMKSCFNFFFIFLSAVCFSVFTIISGSFFCPLCKCFFLLDLLSRSHTRLQLFPP